jgi:hypothetical protein
MLGKHRLVTLLLALFCAGQAGAVELAPYLKSPAKGDPRANAGFQINDGALKVLADVAVKSESAVTRALPQVSSELTVADGIGFVTRVKLPDWNSGMGQSGAIFDTAVRFDPETPILDRIEGNIHRGANGIERRSLKLGFSDFLAWGRTPDSLSITGNAIIEETQRPEAGDSLGMGVQASLSGFSTPGLGLNFLGFADPASSLTMSLRRESGLAADQSGAASFSYDHSWAFQDSARLGLKLEASQAEDGLEPVLGISWQGAF